MLLFCTSEWFSVFLVVGLPLAGIHEWLVIRGARRWLSLVLSGLFVVGYWFLGLRMVDVGIEYDHARDGRIFEALSLCGSQDSPAILPPQLSLPSSPRDLRRRQTPTSLSPAVWPQMPHR